MSEDAPREYDLEYKATEGGRVRRRLGINTDHGEVTRSVLQLEYLTDPGADEHPDAESETADSE